MVELKLKDVLLENQPHANVHSLLVLAKVIRLGPWLQCVLDLVAHPTPIAPLVRFLLLANNVGAHEAARKLLQVLDAERLARHREAKLVNMRSNVDQLLAPRGEKILALLIRETPQLLWVEAFAAGEQRNQPAIPHAFRGQLLHSSFKQHLFPPLAQLAQHIEVLVPHRRLSFPCSCAFVIHVL